MDVPWLFHTALKAPFTKVRFLRIAWLMATSLFLLSGIGNTKPVGTVQIINTNAGRVMTARIDQYENTVYIGGLVYRSSSPAIGAHVHVWGLDQNNHRTFFKTTSVMFTGSPSLTHTASYIVSVSPSILAKTTRIYVTFHNMSHADSRERE